MSYSQLLEQIENQLPTTNKPVYVGFSGGLDSSLLLHAVCDVLDNHRVVAIHCNHGISPDADQWQKFCEHQAQKLKIQLVVERLHFPNGFSEVEGRDARNKVFSSHMQEGALLYWGIMQMTRLKQSFFASFGVLAHGASQESLQRETLSEARLYAL